MDLLLPEEGKQCVLVVVGDYFTKYMDAFAHKHLLKGGGGGKKGACPPLAQNVEAFGAVMKVYRF